MAHQRKNNFYMKYKLPRTVVILGLVSFFNDLASEMVTPFIPILIATVLGAGPVILSEGSERALISVYAHENERGIAFGWYHLAVGLSAIPAGVLFGALWHYYIQSSSFTFTGFKNTDAIPYA
jgi:hypothetical protein